MPILASSSRRLLTLATLCIAPFLLGNDGCGAQSIVSPQPCGSNGNVCGANEYCDTAPDGGAARCEPRPEACTAIYAPVCGTDGKTYASECTAHAAGATVASNGECGGETECPGPAPGAPNYECADGSIGGPTCVCNAGQCGWQFRECPAATACGGIAGITCASGLYCDFAIETMCGSGDQQGTCRTIPLVCTDESAPVCGCDGATYGNSCDAHANGVSVASVGACEVKACSDSDCGPAPASPLPYECTRDASTGLCSWQLACVPPPCAAPLPDCHYEGGTFCTCGTLVCP